MKIKQKLLFLLPLLFLFTPLFSSAQFITTNAPCEPEIIPPLGQIEGVYCPYCSNKGEYLHLKWDLKTNFQDPVCGIECWGPSGDQCYYWSSAEQWFDENGRSKTKLKPKDDVFIKRPPTSPRSAVPGTNLQVHCWEKNDASDPSKKKTSAGIRVYGDNACGLPAGCEERKFADIIANLSDLRSTLITEKNLREWSSVDERDRAINQGSGDEPDLKDHISSLQRAGMENPYFYGGATRPDLFSFGSTRVLRYLKENSRHNNAAPIMLGLYNTVTKDSSAHAIIFLSVEENPGDMITVTYFDPNTPGVASMLCELEDDLNLSLRILFGTRFVYKCSVPDLSLYYDLIVLRTPADSSIYFRNFQKLKERAVRNNTADWLRDSINQLSFGNFDCPLNPKGNCNGYVTFMLRVAYLGEFQSVDCHPDGTISKLFNNSRFLSAISLFGKDLTTKLFKLDK